MSSYGKVRRFSAVTENISRAVGVFQLESVVGSVVVGHDRSQITITITDHQSG